MLQTSILHVLDETEVSVPQALLVFNRVDYVVRYAVVVRTPEHCWVVEKRYSEFFDFRKVVMNEVGTTESQFPAKGSCLFSPTNDSRDAIERRRIGLDDYLRRILAASLECRETAAYLDEFLKQPEAPRSTDAPIDNAWAPVRQSTTLWRASRYRDIAVQSTDIACDSDSDDEDGPLPELCPASDSATLYASRLMPSLPWASHRIAVTETQRHGYNIVSSLGEDQNAVRARWVEFCAFCEWFHSPAHGDAIPSATEALLFVAAHRASDEPLRHSVGNPAVVSSSKKRGIRKPRDGVRLSLTSRASSRTCVSSLSVGSEIPEECASVISVTPPSPSSTPLDLDRAEVMSVDSDGSSSVGPLSPTTATLLTPPRGSSRTHREKEITSPDGVFYNKSGVAFYGY